MKLDTVRCPHCYEAEEIETQHFWSRGPKIKVTCNQIVHAEPKVSVITDPHGPEPMKPGRGTLVHELDLYAKLQDVLVETGGPVGQGVVEHVLAERYPDAYRTLVEKYGHVTTDSDSNYTATSYIASLLGQLEANGHIVRTEVEATGPWAGTGEVAAWRHISTPPGEPMTWADWAKAHDVTAWTAAADVMTAELTPA